MIHVDPPLRPFTGSAFEALFDLAAPLLEESAALGELGLASRQAVASSFARLRNASSPWRASATRASRSQRGRRLFERGQLLA